jgi:hypothetical protein
LFDWFDSRIYIKRNLVQKPLHIGHFWILDFWLQYAIKYAILTIFEKFKMK